MAGPEIVKSGIFHEIFAHVYVRTYGYACIGYLFRSLDQELLEWCLRRYESNELTELLLLHRILLSILMICMYICIYIYIYIYTNINMSL
jgi:hypothetical protein